MDGSTAKRARELRLRRGLSQQDLADRAGVSLRVVQKVEQGGSVRLESLHALARALGAQTVYLVAAGDGYPAPESPTGAQRSQALAELQSALLPPVGPMGWQAPREADPPNLERLTEAVSTVDAAYQRGEYDTVAQLAPALLRSAECHEGTDAHRVRSDLLGLVGRYLTQVRAHELAVVAYRRAVEEANRAGDVLRAAQNVDGQAWVQLRQGLFGEVIQLTTSVAEAIEPKPSRATTGEVAACGVLWLRASAAAARNNEPEQADRYLALAAGSAGTVGRDLPLHEPFGPSTVLIQRADNALVRGAPDQALKGQPVTARVQRYPRHQLDRALALLQTGEPDEATEVLTALRAEFPQWLRQQAAARRIVSDLVATRRRSLSPAQRDLVEFLKL